MKRFKYRRDILPHVIAILVFIIATVIFYHPVYFSGKEINQHDVLQGLGGGHELSEYRKETGKEALWTNSMFSGMPGYLINTQWSGDLLVYVQKIMTLQLPGSAKYTFLGMICFYIMLLAFDVRPYLAIGGSLAFGFTSFNIIAISVGHIWRVVAIAYMPLVIAGIHLVFKRKYLLGFALTAVAFGLEIMSNHIQMTYYLIILAGIYVIVQFIYSIREKSLITFLKQIGIVFLAGLLAIGANFGKLWTTYEYGKYSMRGKSELAMNKEENKSGLEKEYAFHYSNGILEPLVLVVPNFMGGSSQQELSINSHLGEALKDHGLSRKQVEQQLQYVPTYRGKQPLTSPYYAGVILVFLFILGLYNTDKKLKIWLVTAVILSVVLSWGKNFGFFNYFLFDYLPGYNKFRSVTFTIIIAIIGIQLMGMMGLEGWLKNTNSQERQKHLMYALGIISGFLLLLVLFSGIGSYHGPVDAQLSNSNIPDWFIHALRQDRASLLRQDAFRNLFFVLAFGIVLWYLLKGKLSQGISMVLLIILIYLDLVLVDFRYVREDDYVRSPVKSFFTETEADKFILKDTGQFRVLNLNNPFNEARTSYFHSSIGGYHGAKIRRYQDLIDHCISKEIPLIVQKLRQGNRDFHNLNVLNMLNTRYFYAGDKASMVFKNEYALGNAWLVESLVKVTNPDEEIEKTCEIPSDSIAVVDVSKFPVEKVNYNANGEILLDEYKPNDLIYKADLPAESFAVFSEVYYPLGWKAYIDGKENRIMRANYILRAMMLPAGKHTIEFKFRPESYYIGNKVMLISTSLIILILVGVLIYILLKPFGTNE